jgi:hypothetical protein
LPAGFGFGLSGGVLPPPGPSSLTGAGRISGVLSTGEVLTEAKQLTRLKLNKHKPKSSCFIV